MKSSENTGNTSPADAPQNVHTINRRNALKKIKSSGKKIFFTVLPFSLIGLSATKAAAQFNNLEVGRALNFILQIEFMQEAFYVQTTTRNGLIDQPYANIFDRFRTQHQGRVILIKNYLSSLGIDPAPQLNFNFRAGDINPFNSFDQFLNVAQIIEDTASGVYKRQAENIYQNNASNTIKRVVLRLHSTESRHAYYVRFLRAERGLDNIKGWIDRADLGTLPAGFENIYAAEGNVIQDQVDVSSITELNIQTIQEAWDEPIGRGTAGAILQLFTRPL